MVEKKRIEGGDNCYQYDQNDCTFEDEYSRYSNGWSICSVEGKGGCYQNGGDNCTFESIVFCYICVGNKTRAIAGKFICITKS